MNAKAQEFIPFGKEHSDKEARQTAMQKYSQQIAEIDMKVQDLDASAPVFIPTQANDNRISQRNTENSGWPLSVSSANFNRARDYGKKFAEQREQRRNHGLRDGFQEKYVAGRRGPEPGYGTDLEAGRQEFPPEYRDYDAGWGRGYGGYERHLDHRYNQAPPQHTRPSLGYNDDYRRYGPEYDQRYDPVMDDKVLDAGRDYYDQHRVREFDRDPNMRRDVQPETAVSWAEPIYRHSPTRQMGYESAEPVWDDPYYAGHSHDGFQAEPHGGSKPVRNADDWAQAGPERLGSAKAEKSLLTYNRRAQAFPELTTKPKQTVEEKKRSEKSVKELFEKIEKEKYGDLVADSMERNPWDACGRLRRFNDPKITQELSRESNLIERQPGFQQRFPRFRTEITSTGELAVYPPNQFEPNSRFEGRKDYASRQMAKQERLKSFRNKATTAQNIDFEANANRRRIFEQEQEEFFQDSPANQSGRSHQIRRPAQNSETGPKLNLSNGGDSAEWRHQVEQPETPWKRGKSKHIPPDNRGKSKHIPPDNQRTFVDEKSRYDSKYAPGQRLGANVTTKRKVRFEQLATGVVVIRNGIDPDTQIWLTKIAKKEGSKPNHGFWATDAQGVKQLNSTRTRGRIYDKLETYEDGEELTHYATSFVEAIRGRVGSMPQVFPTHLLLLHYASDKGIGWHADDAENDGRNDHPIISFSLGNACEFGIRPIWNHFRDDEIVNMTPKEYKEHSYATAPETVTLNSGDVIVWGGIHRMLVHTVTSVASGTAPSFLRQLVKNVRYNFTFRDCTNILGREDEFKYYIPRKGKSEEERNFRTFSTVESFV